MVDHGAVGHHPDLAALQHVRHRHDQGELLEGALIVVDHGDHGPAVVPGEHDLRGLVEQPAVRLGDVHAAEGGRGIAAQHE